MEIACIPTIILNPMFYIHIPPQLLKFSTNIISGVLAKIINSSILNGVYPPKQKMAEVAAVYKANDITDVNNYRSISLFSHFNRIFEKMILKKNGIFC